MTCSIRRLNGLATRGFSRRSPISDHSLNVALLPGENPRSSNRRNAAPHRYRVSNPAMLTGRTHGLPIYRLVTISRRMRTGRRARRCLTGCTRTNRNPARWRGRYWISNGEWMSRVVLDSRARVNRRNHDVDDVVMPDGSELAVGSIHR